jgi:putative acetyltransferase
MKNPEHQISIEAGTFRIRPIAPSDNGAIKDIILETLIEHGAVGGGFASSDSDTQQMYDAFQSEGRIYFILEQIVQDDHSQNGTRILGGAGIAPLPGEPDTCELVKMYFRPEIRGLGLGKKLLQLCMEAAVGIGYQQIYLETITEMKAARGLYERLGFQRINHPMGSTGHFSCDMFYLRQLPNSIL